MVLTSKQRKFLKGLGHNLSPVIHIGKESITEGVISSINKALDDHELIKIALLETADKSRSDAADTINKETSSELVQILGKKILIYRKNRKKSKIILPS